MRTWGPFTNLLKVAVKRPFSFIIKVQMILARVAVLCSTPGLYLTSAKPCLHSLSTPQVFLLQDPLKKKPDIHLILRELHKILILQ